MRADSAETHPALEFARYSRSPSAASKGKYLLRSTDGASRTRAVIASVLVSVSNIFGPRASNILRHAAKAKQTDGVCKLVPHVKAVSFYDRCLPVFWVATLLIIEPTPLSSSTFD